MPCLSVLGLAALEDGLVRREHRVLEQLDEAAAPVSVGAFLNASISGRAASSVVLHGLDGHRRCDLAGGMAAHAVGDDEEALPWAP